MLTLPFVVLGAATCLAAHPLSHENLERCGSHISAQQILEAEQRFQSLKASSSAPARDSFSFDVYWHVVFSNNGGNISDESIRGQIDVVNKDYASVGISWVLKEITRIENSTWADNLDKESLVQGEMKGRLRKGGVADLNVFSVNSILDGILGYATFPNWYKGNPGDDGVVLRASTLPGNTGPFGLGKTLTHEAGHWGGLYHTFQNGCNAPGDGVDDTPYEESPARGCPTGRDSCPGGGVDPIHNYMDYSDDDCMTEFTTGQRQRLAEQLRVYRINGD